LLIVAGGERLALTANLVIEIWAGETRTIILLNREMKYVGASGRAMSKRSRLTIFRNTGTPGKLAPSAAEETGTLSEFFRLL